MKIILYLFRRSRHWVLAAVLAGIVSGLCHAVLLTIVTRGAAQTSTATQVLLVFAGLCVLMVATRITSQTLLAKISQAAIFDLRLRLCQQIIAAPLRTLETIGIPKLYASLTDDVMTIGSAFSIFPILCAQVTVMIALLLYLGVVSWAALAVTLGMLALGVTGFRLLMKRTMAAWGKARASQNEMHGHFSALTGGIKELKLHKGRRASFITDMLNLTADAYRRENVVAVAQFSMAGGWGQMVQFALLGLTAIVLPQAGIIASDAVLPALLIILYLISPLNILASNMPTMGQAKIALDAINTLGLSLEEQSNEAASEGPLDIARHWHRLELDAVTHRYQREGEPHDFEVGPIDLAFQPGEVVFLVGGNGSGKTTLAKLIAGLYSAEQGEVRLDGRAITDENRDEYRQMFSIVFSDFFLFERLLGLEHTSLDERAAEYLKTLRLDANVQVTDGKFSTTRLSQGQRKRLALLTAYLENRSIYIFDEWAADQDPEFKRVFYQVLLPELKARGKTVIAISHDDAYYPMADRIVKLNYGRIESDWRRGGRIASSVPVQAGMPVRVPAEI